jgi:hypothetical protein
MVLRSESGHYPGAFQLFGGLIYNSRLCGSGKVTAAIICRLYQRSLINREIRFEILSNGSDSWGFYEQNHERKGCSGGCSVFRHHGG